MALISIVAVLCPFLRRRSPRDQISRNLFANFIANKETIYDNIESLQLEYDLGQISKEDLDKNLLSLKHEAAEIMQNDGFAEYHSSRRDNTKCRISDISR